MKRILLSSLLTLLFFSLVVVTVEPDQLKIAFSSLDLTIVFRVFLLVFLNQLIRAIRFQLVLSKQPDLDLFFVLRVTCVHQFLNHVLPMRTGEMSFPFLLGKYTDSTYSSSLASLLLVRLYDAIILLAFFLLAFGVLVRQSSLDLTVIESSLALFGGSGLFLCVLLLLLFFAYKKNSRAASSQSNPSTDKVEKNAKNKFKPAGKISKWISQFLKEFRLYRGGVLHLKLFLLSVMIWVSLLCLFRTFLFSSGLVVSWSVVVAGSGLASLTQLLPINTFGNIGTLEAGWVLGFSLLGLDADKVLIAGISMHVLVIAASALYAILSWVSLSYKSRS